MTKFFERYGDWVLFSVLCIIVVGGVYGVVHFLATLHVLPGALNVLVLEGHDTIRIILEGWANKLQDKWPMFGAAFQAAASAFAIVQGIGLMRRFLPKRLQTFIDQEIKFIYPVRSNILAAEQLIGTTDRRALLPVASQALFQPRPLVQALKNLGRTSGKSERQGVWKYTAIKIRSINDVITETDRVIEVAEKRLIALRDIRLHGHLVRGALNSAKTAGKSAQSETGALIDSAEQDFTTLVKSEHMNLVGLELRGLLASRDDGRLVAAAKDFKELDEAAIGDANYLTRARSKRYQAELLTRQSKGRVNKLTEALLPLVEAFNLIRQREKLSATDKFELGENRLAFGRIRAAKVELGKDKTHLAESALAEAIEYYVESQSPLLAQRVEEIKLLLKNLEQLDTPDQTGETSGGESERPGSSANN